jgi:hypothetical protein
MKSFGIREIELAEAPDPKICIIEMINIQLKVIFITTVYKEFIKTILCLQATPCPFVL